MPVVITGNNTPTAGGITYGDGSTYANTAAGTSGQPVVSGGAGAPVFRPYTLPAADGSASQVLQTNGSGALSFATPSAGALTFLSTVTASNSATVDVETTFSSTYDVYLLIASGVTSQTDGRPLLALMKIGGSYVTSGYKYHATETTSASASYAAGADSAATSLSVLGGTVGNAADESGNFKMIIYSPASTALAKQATWEGSSMNSTGVLIKVNGAGLNTGTSALTGIRFKFDTGNVVAGKFRLYGIANS
jgi:hypothetical protein